MSKPETKYREFGFEKNPFSVDIATQEVASQYKLVGRDEQEYQLDQFIKEGIRHPENMKKRLIFGEYGTGKSHHMINLRDRIREGIEIEGNKYKAIAVYVENLGFSIKRLYEKILDGIKSNSQGIKEEINSLDPVEPEESVDEAYRFEKLRDNISENLRKIARIAIEKYEYSSIFIFIDEAEDIANPSEEEKGKLPKFIRSFLTLVNDLNASGIHMLLGFSQGARMRITSHEEDEDALGNALMQRFQGGEIYLGNLRKEDVKEMLIDRMDKHRKSNKGTLSPIVESTVEVVTEITGGHPREILSIYSQALESAIDMDLDTINGDSIVHALIGFKSFVRDEELISQEAIINLKKSLEKADPQARKDFEELQGRLIGEAEKISEDVFSNNVPNKLLAPITIKGEETELRILENRTEHGKNFYILSEEAKDFIFSGAEGEGTQIQKLDLKASNAPKKYQSDLSRGLGIALQNAAKGILHKSTVSESVDRYEYSLYLFDIKTGPGKGDQTVALGVYNGQEIPKKMVKLYIESIKNKEASFGVLVKENQQLSAGANKYLSDIDSVESEYYKDRVLEVDLTTEQRDKFIYGNLLALGDSETQADKLMEENELIDELDFMEKLEEIIEDYILPYPDQIYRDLINYLESRDEQSFTISNLRDELNIKQHSLNTDIMEGLKSQNLVSKEGQRWKYPDIESNRPPWYKIYQILKKESEPISVSELISKLSKEYVFDCPKGGENEMLQWYLDHLQRQNYVEPETINKDGKEIDAYTVVSVSDQYSEALSKAEDRFEKASEFYNKAVNLNVENINDYENSLDDIKKKLEDHHEILDPEHSDLNKVKDLTEEIRKIEENIEKDLKEKRKIITGDTKNLLDHKIPSIKGKISNAEIQGSFADQLQSFNENLSDLETEMEELIENENYERLQKRKGEIKEEIDKIEQQVEEVIDAKSRCTEKYKEIQEIKEEAEDNINGIFDSNPEYDELRRELKNLNSKIDNYEKAYNNGEYEKALNILKKDVKSFAKKLKSNADRIYSEQERYLSQLKNLEEQVESSEGKDKIEQVRKNIEEGNFAKVSPILDEIKDLIQGPTRKEQFIKSLKDYNGSLEEVISGTDFNKSESFKHLNDLYKSQKIEDLKVIIKNE